MLGQPIPHLVYRLEVYLNNSVDWEMVREDPKCVNWNRAIRSSCPVSSLNETLLRVIRDIVSKWTIVVRKGDKPCFDDRCVLDHSEVEHLEYQVVAGSRLIGESIEWLVVMLSLSMNILNGHSLNGANYS